MSQIVKNRTIRRIARHKSATRGTSERPRLVVIISNRQVAAQIIDDTKAMTLASITTSGAKVKGSLTEKATWAGAEIAKRASAAKIKAVVLDRNGRKYHGRLKALAEAARENGLEF